MVGIAGKSKGCATCRRRKIRCDLLKPACEKCTKSGRQCEGYERYPVFLIRTVDGSKKRKWLEETKVSSRPDVPNEHDSDHSSAQETTDSLSRTLSPNRSFSASPGNANIDPSLLSDNSRSTNDLSVAQLSDYFKLTIEDSDKSSTVQDIPNGPSPKPAYEKHLLSLFWDSYASSRPSLLDAKRDTCSWLYHAMNTATQTSVLYQALLSLSLTTLGNQTKNKDLLRLGHSAYSKALCQLQQALLDPYMSMQDETLASARAMLWYELLEATSGDGRSWYSHLSGVASLVHSRGCRSYRSPLALAVFEDVRYALMMQALMQRQTSPFAERDWLIEPWQGHSKTPEQMINDCGFKIAALLQKGDDWIRASEGMSSPGLALELLKESNKLYRQLEERYANHLEGLDSELEAGEESAEPAQPTYDPRSITFVLTVWSLQLTLGFLADPLASHVNTEFRHSPRFSEVQETLQTADKYSDDLKRSDIAHNVLQLVKVAIDGDFGQKVSSKIIFPIFCLSWQFCQSRKMLAEIQTLRQQLAKQRGIRFAGSAAKGTSVFSHGIKEDGTLVCQRDGTCCDARCFPSTYLIREISH